MFLLLLLLLLLFLAERSFVWGETGSMDGHGIIYHGVLPGNGKVPLFVGCSRPCVFCTVLSCDFFCPRVLDHGLLTRRIDLRLGHRLSPASLSVRAQSRHYVMTSKPFPGLSVPAQIALSLGCAVIDFPIGMKSPFIKSVRMRCVLLSPFSLLLHTATLFNRKPYSLPKRNLAIQLVLSFFDKRKVAT